MSDRRLIIRKEYSKIGMKKKVRLGLRFLTVFLIIMAVIVTPAAKASTDGVPAGTPVTIVISPEKDHKEISPYIYGINDGANLFNISAKSMRIGGNRLTAYNWENNYSNAGADWYNNSDAWLVRNLPADQQNTPGALGIYLSNTAGIYKIPFTLLTLQMCGYAAADGNGSVSEIAPSARWNKIEYRKNDSFSETPDLTDGVVYMDEYVNYLVNKLGDSTSPTGIKAYALDNEPALWSGTHNMIQQEPLKCSELIEKSAALSSAVKDVDANALIFGPALYGFNAFTSFQNAPDWEQLKKEGNYRWFIDYYLDLMSKESDQEGRRFLDVLDIHYYTEAKGPCGTRSSNCTDYTNEGCLEARMQSPRTLYEEGYIEDSWIGQWGKEFLPILPNIQESIEQYYPGTKIAITEYNFGGGDHISGGVAEADALGVFAENGVFCANLWPGTYTLYQDAAINLYTDYDGNDSGFGNTLISSKSDNIEISSVYSAIDDDNTDIVRAIITNKKVGESIPADISIDSDKKYICAQVYSITGESSSIRRLDNVNNISDNSFTYELPPMSVTEFVLMVNEDIQEEDSIKTSSQADTSTDVTPDTKITAEITPATTPFITAAPVSKDEISSTDTPVKKNVWPITAVASLLVCISIILILKLKKKK